MKPKPTLKVELSVRKCDDRYIRMAPHSNDAKSFVLEEAPKYGTLYPEGRYLDLLVLDGYDFNEVAEYFESYNDDSGGI